MDGYLLKVVYGSGGHQDNVFEESYNFCEWVLEHGIQHELYVVLIDTDMKTSFNSLRDKYHQKKKIKTCLLLIMLNSKII